MNLRHHRIVQLLQFMLYGCYVLPLASFDKLMRMSQFDQIFARLDRANVHGQAAINFWLDLFKDNPSSAIVDEQGYGVAVISAVFSKPLGDSIPISIELGEFLYQLRAALDSAVFELASHLRRPAPPIKESRLYFPIFEKASYFESSSFNANFFPNEMKSWVESIQPYNTEVLSDLKQKSLSQWLFILHQMCNIDKHRRLHLAAIWPGKELIGSLSLPEGSDSVRIEGIQSNFLEGKFEFLRLEVKNPISGPRGRIHVKTTFTPQITIEGIPLENPWDGIESMSQAVRYAVERFAMVQNGEQFKL